ncbi:hypothetical protein [Liquorilactobacillus uvarum]|uniref:hypothetical protein n=1 Tax=Liquorilactobacillus uvarum TaxID=303240 RepID=UPI0012EDD7D4|nr:hypothetical protein [Liquorilactobacillus uvarum]
MLKKSLIGSMIQMRTNDLISLYVSYVETNGGKSRPVLIRKVSEQTVKTFKNTSKKLFEIFKSAAIGLK